MNWRTVGYGLTAAALVLTIFVAAVEREDWWAGPAVFGVMVALYWALGPVLFASSDAPDPTDPPRS